MIAPLPENESQRLDALRRCNILDTEAEAAFDDLVGLAAAICQTPIALVSLIDPLRQWFKAKVGVTTCETSRDIAFCAHAILQNEIFEVPDALTDPRFTDNPLVTGTPFIRFYAGVPLVTAEGHALGTLCVIDHEPRQLTSEQRQALIILGRQTVRLIERRLRQTSLILDDAAPRWLPWTIGGLCFAIACLDFATPLGIIIPALYLVPMALTVGIPEHRASRLTGLLCIGLTIAGFFFSPPGASSWFAMVNRTITVALLGIAVILAGHFTRHLSTVRRIQNEKILLANTQAQIVESSPNGILIVRQDGIITLANTQIERQFGYSRNELLNQPIELLIPNHFWPQYPGPRTAFFHLPTTRAMEASHELSGRRKDGAEFPLELRLNSLNTLDGLHILASVIDITSRKQAETEREAQETRLRAIVDHAIDGIITIDEQGLIESFNPAAERLFGYTATEAIGQNVKLLMPEPYHSEHDGYLAHYRQTGQAKIIGIGQEVVGRTKEGTVFPLELGISETIVGSRHFFTGIIRDISDRKEAEFKLEQAALQLECHNLELAEAHDRALASSRAKSEFLATMSHEIRTPMNAIIGMADLLLETSLTEDQCDYVERFNRAATSLLGLINNILDLSKIEAGHLEIECIPFDLEDLVETTGELMAVRADAKHLELIVHIDPRVPRFLIGDPTRLQQVLINLLGNAIKFTERGEVVLRVSLDEADPALLHLSVADTGIGIPEDKLDSVFESFAQVDSSTTRKFGGTGLGLSISRNLVELMGGRLWAESMLGMGTTIHLTARFAEGAHTSSPSNAASVYLAAKRILVVDDNDTNCLIVKEILAPSGALVTDAHDGATALSALLAAQASGAPFELVILDCRMPGQDGFAVATAMQASPDLAAIPAIMLTSDLHRGDLGRARTLGIRKHINKPIRRLALLNIMSAALVGTDQTHPNQPIGAVSGPAAASPTPPAEHAPTGRILLAEDFEDNRDVITLFLKRTAYELTYAENGAVAVEKFKAGAYDLVFMDMQMPVMDGYEATSLIRAWEKEQARVPTPILALTANAFTEEREKSLAAGCTAHLTKPIKKKTLLTAIADYVRRPLDNAA